jgi:hypothetical protein
MMQQLSVVRNYLPPELSAMVPTSEQLQTNVWTIRVGYQVPPASAAPPAVVTAVAALGGTGGVVKMEL